MLGLSKMLAGFHPRSLPLMARLSYDRELLSWSLLPVMLSGLQSGTMAVFVKKTFADIPGVSVEQLNLAVGLVTAAKAIGHLSSFLWASASHGRHKIRFIVWLQVVTALMIGLIAFAPRSATGLWAVTGLCIVAWMAWSGVVTLRTGVWRANYHKSYRARVAGKLSIVYSLVMAAAGAIIGFSLDLDSRSYRILFPVLAAAGAVGALFYTRVRLRRHKQQLSAERRADTFRRPAFSPLVVAHVLSSDRHFAVYMACMFVMGAGNFMLHAPLAIVLSEQFDAGYQTGIAITAIIPLLCMTAVIPFWGRLLERMHVISFRSIHAWTFVAASTLVLLGTAVNQLVLLYVAAVAIGIGWGGGVLAWNLGHQHFAPPARDAEYMGVHVTLAGIRGFVGPLLAVKIYDWLAPWGWQAGIFAICCICNVLGAIGFALVAWRTAPSPTCDPADFPRARSPTGATDEANHE